MINLNDDTGAVDEILRAIAKEYHWPNYPRAALRGRWTQVFLANALVGRYDAIVIVTVIITALGVGLWLRRARRRS